MTYHDNVIQFPLSPTWVFFDYIESNENNPIEGWCRNEMSFEAKEIFNNILKDCAKTDNPANWLHSRQLKGKMRGFWELKFKCDGRQYRFIGEFGPARKQATILAGCYHKDKIYTPPNAFDLALNRSAKLRRKEASRNERKIRLDR